MSRTEYEAIDAVNWSTLKHMAASPLHYHYALTHPRPDTDAMALGRAIHAATLEPEAFADRYRIWPSTGPDGKATRRAGGAWDAFAAAALAAGAEVIREQDLPEVQAVAAAVRAHPAAARILAAGRPEATLEWTDDETGVPCKGRADLLCPGAGGVIVDLKSTADLSPEAFARSCESLDYLGQLAYYAAGAAATHGGEWSAGIIAVESDAPYDVVVYEVPGEHLEHGHRLWRRLLDRVAECRETGRWPGRSESVITYERPAWATRRQS